MYICLKLINYILIRQPAARPEDRAKVLMASDLVRRNVRSLRRRVKLVVAAPRVDAAWRHRSQRISSTPPDACRTSPASYMHVYTYLGVPGSL